MLVLIIQLFFGVLTRQNSCREWNIYIMSRGSLLILFLSISSLRVLTDQSRYGRISKAKTSCLIIIISQLKKPLTWSLPISNQINRFKAIKSHKSSLIKYNFRNNKRYKFKNNKNYKFKNKTLYRHNRIKR